MRFHRHSPLSALAPALPLIDFVMLGCVQSWRHCSGWRSRASFKKKQVGAKTWAPLYLFAAVKPAQTLVAGTARKTTFASHGIIFARAHQFAAIDIKVHHHLVKA